MISKQIVDDFLAQKTLAIVGTSRSGKKFGNTILKELKKKGYRVIPVHPEMKSILGEPCYPSLSDLPEQVGGLIVVVRPEKAKQVVRDAAEAGIQRIWMQQGSESDEAIQFCREKDIALIHGECVMMFAEPVGFLHRIHRWIWGVLGKLPR